jgi:hypothetical protein
MVKAAKGAKSGKGRTISKLKRNNQKRNKLIKSGEIKPKTGSKSPWIAKQQSDQERNKRIKEERKKNAEKRKNAPKDEDEEEEEQFDPDDMMTPEDALLLAGEAKPKKKQKLEDFETAALRRYDENREGDGARTKVMLPIKTKKGGLVMQHAKVQSQT